jgi:glycosyltransferase involved in cell wall biosynthesis
LPASYDRLGQNHHTGPFSALEGGAGAVSLSAEAVISRTAFIIPVYNHAGTLGAVIKKVLAFDRPLFVVDDGSTDDTPRVLEGLSGVVTVIRQPVNLGKGAALMTGFAAAAPLCDWALTLDADGQHDPLDALSLIGAVTAGARPIVLGKRVGMAQKGAPWTSRWGRGFSNFWVFAASGLVLSDTQSGFRLYPLPESLQLHPQAKRFQFEVEVLVLAAWSGIPVVEAEISVHYPVPGQHVSHFRPARDFWRNTLTFSRLLAKRVLLSRSRRSPRIKP